MDISKKFADNKIIDSKGYIKGRLLSKDDLTMFRATVAAHVSSVIGEKVSFEEVLDLKEDSLSKIIINKSLRIFKKKDAEKLLKSESILNLISVRKNIKICNATDPLIGVTKKAEIYFRIVMPNSGGNPELGHIDWWYDDLYQIPKNERPTHKIWISLKTESGKNGLLVKKIDDELTYNFNRIETAFGPRPRLKNPLEKEEYDFPKVKSGEAIIFDSQRTLHMGAKNLGLRSRISIEISVRVENEQ